MPDFQIQVVHDLECGVMRLRCPVHQVEHLVDLDNGAVFTASALGFYREHETCGSSEGADSD